MYCNFPGAHIAQRTMVTLINDTGTMGNGAFVYYLNGEKYATSFSTRTGSRNSFFVPQNAEGIYFDVNGKIIPVVQGITEYYLSGNPPTERPARPIRPRPVVEPRPVMPRPPSPVENPYTPVLTLYRGRQTIEVAYDVLEDFKIYYLKESNSPVTLTVIGENSEQELELYDEGFTELMPYGRYFFVLTCHQGVNCHASISLVNLKNEDAIKFETPF